MDINDYIHPENGMPWKPYVALFVGTCGSGKSYLMESLLYRNFHDAEEKRQWAEQEVKAGRMNKKDLAYYTPFQHVLIISGSAFSGAYDYQSDKRYRWKEYDNDKLNKYLKHFEEYPDKHDGELPPRNLVIIDDKLGDKKLLNSGLFENLGTIHRHYNMTIWLSGQYLNKLIGPSLRTVCNFMYMFQTRNRDSLEALMKCAGQLLEKDHEKFGENALEKFKKLLTRATSERYHYLRFVNNVRGDTEEEVRRLSYTTGKAAGFPKFTIQEKRKTVE